MPRGIKFTELEPKALPVVEVSGIQVEGVVLGLLDLPVEVIVVQIHHIRNLIAYAMIRHFPVLLHLQIYQRKIWQLFLEHLEERDFIFSFF